jgi:hypothetical protein
MKRFPTICIDNFYENPDEVRDFALSLNYTKCKDGKWPGERTDCLYEINKNFWETFYKRLFSIFYDTNYYRLGWNAYSSFQKIYPYSLDKDSIKNIGWIHNDNDVILAGLIYLTPNTEKESGTSIYRQNGFLDQDSYLKYKHNFFKGNIVTNYDDKLKEHNSYFEETVRFDNIYNRLVAYDGEEYHAASSYYSSSQPRLTQVFFVKKINCESNYPLMRKI